MLLIIIIIIINSLVKNKKYKDLGYKEKTGLSRLQVKYNRGNAGEYSLYLELLKIFPKEHIFADLYVPTDKGYTQIDLVAISNKKIYLFEMKNFSGSIMGFENNKYWRQSFNPRTTYEFYNPIWQARAHQRALENYLKTRKFDFENIVVFSNKVDFYKIQQSGDVKILKMANIFKFITAYEEKSNNYISNKKRDNYLMLLNSCSNVSADIKALHLKQVQEAKRKHIN